MSRSKKVDRRILLGFISTGVKWYWYPDCWHENINDCAAQLRRIQTTRRDNWSIPALVTKEDMRAGLICQWMVTDFELSRLEPTGHVRSQASCLIWLWQRTVLHSRMMFLWLTENDLALVRISNKGRKRTNKNSARMKPGDTCYIQLEMTACSLSYVHMAQQPRNNLERVVTWALLS